MAFRAFLPTVTLACVFGLVGALFFVGTMVAYWQIIVPLASPSAQDWRRFVSDLAGDVFPIFWTYVLYLIAVMSASIFLPQRLLQNRLLSVCLIVYVAYAQASFWALSAVRAVNLEGAQLMAACLINPLCYPLGIFASVPICFAIYYVRRIEAWNLGEMQRLLLVLPLAFLLLGAPLFCNAHSIAESFAKIWHEVG